MTFDANDEVTAVMDDSDFDNAAHTVTVEVPDHDDATSEQADEILVLDEAPDPQATLPVWEPTGNPAVDAALEELHAVAQSDLAEHAEIYERVQQSLRATLDALAADDDPA